MNPRRPLTAAEIADAAAAWLARRDRGFTAAEQDEFLHWLAEDARHRAAFAELELDWSGLDALAQWRPQHSATPNPDLLARPANTNVVRGPWQRWRIGIAAAAATIAIASGVSWFAEHNSATKEVPLAQTRPATVVRDAEQMILEDGSVLDLNRGAAVEVRYTTAERAVWLVQGEAHFTVAKNPARPFVVRAGKVAVRAVGTAFNVRLDEASAVEVIVTEGRVQVAPPASSSTASAPTTILPELGAGQRAWINDSGAAHIDSVSADEMARALAWQPRQLEFDSARLSDVVEAFNRHNRVQLVVIDARLADVSIGASFRSNNVEGFVRLLEASFDITAERKGDRIELRAAR